MARLSQAIQACGDRIEIITPLEYRPSGRVLESQAVLIPPLSLGVGKNIFERALRKCVRFHRNLRAWRVFRRLFRAGDAATIWLLHTANFAEIEVVLRAFSCVGAKDRKHFGVLKIIIRSDHYDEPLRRQQFRSVLDLAGKNVEVYTDTQELALSLSACFHGSVTAIPVAGAVLPISDLGGRPYRFGYFGLRRKSKGFDRLAALIEALPGLVEGGGFQIVAHGNSEVDATEDHGSVERRLEALGVKLQLERVSAGAYVRALQATEIVLLPYDPFIYRFGSSGVFVDALRSGCSVIVPSGTWMAKEAKRHRLSRVFEADFGSPEGVWEVANIALAQRERGEELSSIERAWMIANSPEGVVEALRTGSL